MKLKVKPKHEPFSKEDRYDHNCLTKRQSEILHLVAAGNTDKEMGGALGISEDTIAHHLRILYRKYEVHCRAALLVKTVISVPSLRQRVS